MAVEPPIIDLPPDFLPRWRSGSYVGTSRPTGKVLVRRGRFDRRYATWPGRPFGRIAGRSPNAHQWQAFWNPSEDYTELPNVEQFEVEQSFDNNGIATLTVTMTNQAFVELTGAAGTYHAVQKGLYSPFYGYQHPGRPAVTERQNEWFQRLNGKAQITVLEGYGTATPKTFTGLIDDIDVTSVPGAIQIVSRDFGQVLADESFFGWVMDPILRGPITFMPGPKLGDDDEEKVGGAPEASSFDSAHPPSYVLDLDGDTYWRTDGMGEESYTEWLQIHLPAGKYHRFYLHPQYDNMEIYVSVYARHRGAKIPRHCLRDGEALTDADLDVDNTFGGIPEGFIRGGLGEVPGENGGHPYLKMYPQVNNVGRYFNLPGTFDLGAGSVLRISFRNLGKSMSSSTPRRTVYRAGAKRLIAMKIKATPEDTESTTKKKRKVKQKSQRIVYVSDVSDIARVILRWAGFKEWRIEDTGTNITAPLTVSNDTKLIDTIAKLKEATGFCFFMGPPSSSDLSIGTPIFRRARVFQAPTVQEESVSGDTILTNVTQKFTDEPLRYIIRARGAVPNPKKKTSKPRGQTLGGDTTRRYMFTYVPPWSKRMAGVIRHLLYPNAELDSTIECEVACYLIAFQIALANATAMFSVPGTPHISLDALTHVRDANTGSNMRVYVSNVRRTMRLGDSPAYDSEYGGAIPDTPDIQEIALRYLDALRRLGIRVNV